MRTTFCEHDLDEILCGRRRWLEETLLALGRREDFYTKPYWHSDGVSIFLRSFRWLEENLAGTHTA